MQCKKCGETLRFFDRFCRKCGEKRESLPYEPVNESELDFAVHSECYNYLGTSVVSRGEGPFSMKFCEHNGFIYAKEKGAVIKIDAEGNRTWIRLENAEEITGYVDVILVNSCGIFIRNTEMEYFLYNATGKLIKKINLECADAKLEDFYLFGDKMYILYSRREDSLTTPYIVEYNVLNDIKRVVLDFETLWDEIVEYTRLGEERRRRIGKSYFDEEIPDVMYKEELNSAYACAEQFGVNSRRLVVAFSTDIDSSIIGCSSTLLLDVNLSDLTVTLLTEIGSANNHSKNTEISFLNMSTETFWVTNRFTGGGVLFQYPMAPREELKKEESLNSWRDSQFGAKYMDGKNFYGAHPYTFCSLTKEGIETDWAQASYGDTPRLTVLGEFLYERHGAACYSGNWDFYYKKDEPSLAFSISVADIEEEYNNPELCVAAEDTEEPIVKFCMTCGAKVVSGARFCYQCGAELSLK